MAHIAQEPQGENYTVTDIAVIRDAWGERREGEIVGTYQTLQDARKNAQHLQDVYFADDEPAHTHLIIINDIETGELVDEYVVGGSSAPE